MQRRALILVTMLISMGCERDVFTKDTTFGNAEAKGGNGESGGNGGKIEPTVPVYLVAAPHHRCNTVFTGSFSKLQLGRIVP